MIQISAAANSATPTNSLTRRETVDPLTCQISMMTGSTNGRRPERLRKKRRSSTRSFSLISPWSVRSSTLACSMTSASSARAVGEQRLAVFHDEAARDDVGHAFERAGLLVDRDDRHDEAVFGEVPAIAQHFVADLAGPRAVDQHAADRRLAGDARAVARRSAATSPFSASRISGCGSRPANTRSATRACCESWRYSPWTGTK